MAELPSDLAAMLEAVEKYMGEQFTDMLAEAIDDDCNGAFQQGFIYALKRIVPAGAR